MIHITWLFVENLLRCFKEKPWFHDEDQVDDNIINDVTNMNHEKALNLDELKIVMKTSKDNDAIQMDKDIIHKIMIK